MFLIFILIALCITSGFGQSEGLGEVYGVSDAVMQEAAGSDFFVKYIRRNEDASTKFCLGEKSVEVIGIRSVCTGMTREYTVHYNFVCNGWTFRSFLIHIRPDLSVRTDKKVIRKTIRSYKQVANGTLGFTFNDLISLIELRGLERQRTELDIEDEGRSFLWVVRYKLESHATYVLYVNAKSGKVREKYVEVLQN